MEKIIFLMEKKTFKISIVNQKEGSVAISEVLRNYTLL